MKFSKFDSDTEYGKGYSDGVNIAEQYTVRDISQFLENWANQLAILRSLKATYQSDILKEAAEKIRLFKYKNG